jgi:hypothetical protein
MDFIKQDSIQIRSKINKIFTSSKIIPYLDDATLRFKIIQML